MKYSISALKMSIRKMVAIAFVAQLVERLNCNQLVVGSSPIKGSCHIQKFLFVPPSSNLFGLVEFKYMFV